MASDARLCDQLEEPLDFAILAMTQQLATLDDVKQAADSRRKARPLIGQLAVTTRRLSIADVFRVLGEQAFTREPFGEAAVRLEFLTGEELYELLQLQADLTPSLSEMLVNQGVLEQDQAEEFRRQLRERRQEPANPAQVTSDLAVQRAFRQSGRAVPASNS